MKSIAGLPMKPATKTFTGLSYSVTANYPERSRELCRYQNLCTRRWWRIDLGSFLISPYVLVDDQREAREGPDVPRPRSRNRLGQGSGTRRGGRGARGGLGPVPGRRAFARMGGVGPAGLVGRGGGGGPDRDRPTGRRDRGRRPLGTDARGGAGGQHRSTGTPGRYVGGHQVAGAIGGVRAA